MLKWESRLAPLFFYATVAVLKLAPMRKKSRTQRNIVRDSLELYGDHGAVKSQDLVLISPESKRQLWNLQVQVRRV
jgi:hypothetical protein